MSEGMNEKVDAMRSKLASKLKSWDRPIWGYKGAPPPERKEGDVWVDEDKTWTVKNGIKQSISKSQDAKIPWWCPKCDNSMCHRFDTKFYNLYGQCYDCTVKQHTKMMANGTWDAFEQKKLRENEKSYLKDMIQERKDYIRTFRVPEVHYGDGNWDRLAELSMFNELFATIRKDIEFCEGRLKEIEEEELKEQEHDNA